MGRRGGTHSPGSLPAISEDETSEPSPSSQTNPLVPPSVPAVPARALNRPQREYLWGISHPPRVESPPEYLNVADVEGPKGEKLAEVRRAIANNKHLAKRGGFKTLALFILLALLCIVAVVVGVVIGLRNHKKSTNNSSGGPDGGASGNLPNPNGPSNATFPAGSYSIDTVLSTVSANCTSNAATWRCFPFSTYAESPAKSATNFDWIITPDPKSSNYLISTTPNVFAVLFTNISLSLMNATQDTEHYYFQTTMQKATIPNSPLTPTNSVSMCYFNQTNFQGYLYTKMEKTYPNNSTTANATEPYGPWPYAVRIEQTSPGGPGIPTCLDPSGKSQGNFSVSDTTESCQCEYLNTGT